jgi:drug/metabolite transporter (DMT)-like permease
MAALGLGQFALLVALLNFGLQHIGAAQAALIFSLFPLLTMLLSATLGREPISARLGACCGVFYRPYLRRYPTLNVSAFAMLVSVPFLAVLALPEHWPQRVTALPPQTWAVVIFIGASSGIGYFLWLYALKHETPTRVTVFLALNPVTAGILGSLLLHEVIDGWMVGATVLIGVGLWLAARTREGKLN